MCASAAKTWNGLAEGSSSAWPAGRSARTAVAAVILILLGLGGLLLARRLAGAFTAELTTPGLLVTALITTAVASAARLAWQSCSPRESTALSNLQRAEYLFIGWGSSAALLLVAVGTSFRSDRLSDILIWLPLLAMDQLWRLDFFDGCTTRTGAPETLASTEPPSLEFTPVEVLRENASDKVVQQVFRVREADGSEAVYARLLAHFVAGQRHQAVYLGFCPPLEYVPTVRVDPCAGPSAHLKVSQSFAHGTRIDVKLTAPASAPATVVIDLAARRKQNDQ
jgi:hypothetical protein